MGLKRLGVGLDGAAVEAGGIVGTVLRIGHVAGIEQGAGVGGMGGEPGVKLGLGGFPIGFGDGGFSVYDLIGRRLGSVDSRWCFGRGVLRGRLSRGGD